MELIRPFNKLGRHDAALAGGKGASLGEMTQAGIPVPPGYVILSDAFERFIEETNVNVEIDSILHKVKHEEIHTVENASEAIKALILQATMPKDIANEIKKNFKQLGAKFVAVRSSATAEDSSAAAWAGQLESYLNTTESNVLENVKHCWASLFTPRAIFYRFEKGLHTTKISVAVVVQKMVESEISGIAFSVHPVTQDHNQLIIEAGLGLGEAIVSGQITPDSYVIEKEPRRIFVGKQVAEQEKGMYKKEGGGNEWRDVRVEGKKQKLADAEILELAELILRIERHYGFPCDIEWAREKGQFYIVQSRPITTLSPVDATATQEASEDSEKKDKDQWHVIASDFNSFFLRSQIFVKGINRSGSIIPSLKPFTKSLAIRGKEGKIEYLTQLYLWQEMHTIFSNEITKDISSLKNVIEETNTFGDNAIAFARKLSSQPTSTKSNGVLIKELQELRNRQEMLYAYGVLLPLLDFADKTYIQTTLQAALEKALSPDKVQEAFITLTQPNEDSFSVEEERDLLNLALEAQKDATIKQLFEEEDAHHVLTQLEKKAKAFYSKLMHHAETYAWVYYAFAGPATKPLDYINSLKELIKTDPAMRLLELKSNKKKLSEDKKEIITKYAKNEFTKQLFNLAGTFVWAKPRRKDYQSCLYYYMIEYYIAEVAKRINATKEQLVSLPFEDIEDALLHKKKIDSKKAAQLFKEHVLIPTDEGIKVFYGDELAAINKKIIAPTHEANASNELKGMTAYAGKVSGRVVIVNTPQEMGKVKAGDILVSVATTPSIVPAMKKAAAFVTDEGGLTCHASIVAREMRKPCIVGTKIATHVLHDGDLVEIDADKGIVKIIKQHAS